MSRDITASISCNALKHNLQQVRNLVGSSKVLAVVKANAYGHGIVEVAKALADADALAVACMQEALAIRHAQVKTDILLIEGVFDIDELSLVQEHALSQVVHCWEQIAFLRKYTGPIKQPFKVWLKINSGLNRLGFSLQECRKAYAELSNLEHVKIQVLMSHLANADDKNDPFTLEQLERFNEVTADLSGERSFANSAGVLGWPQTYADWVRPGVMLYGVSPFAQTLGEFHDLQPVMTLRTHVISVHTLKPGDTVGYSRTWENQKPNTQIAIIAIGYADGYPRHLPNGTPVLVNGKQANIVGRISMDMCAIDVSDVGQVKIGDPVILWGDQLPLEVIAQAGDLLVHDLLCRASNLRIRYIYTD